jgi:hypothetical protein
MAFNLTPEELARFHAYIQQGGSLTPSAPNPRPSAFQHTQVPSSGPSAAQPFLQQTQVQNQPSVIQSQAGLQPTNTQFTNFTSSGPSSIQPLHSQQTQAHAQPSMTQPPPISQLYQNIRPHQLGHPQAATTSTTSYSSRPNMGFNPFLGGAALNLPTAHANQARLASALSSIPRNPSLPRIVFEGPTTATAKKPQPGRT